jgi:hypothetical protein
MAREGRTQPRLAESWHVVICHDVGTDKLIKSHGAVPNGGR